MTESSHANPENALPAVLREIMEFKREEIESAKRTEPLDALAIKIEGADPTRDFFGALVKPNTPGTRVIAEVKRRSPSAGLIRPEYDRDCFKPDDIALQYSQSGASAISCLTDEKFFGGSLAFINRIKQRVNLPVIRKDFILDIYQIDQSRAYGADAVLLIAECLESKQITELLDRSHELDLDVLLEVHSKANLLRVQPLIELSDHKQVLLGINNRDLTKMVTNLNNTTDLIDLVNDPSILVSESGIRTHEDLAHLNAHRVHIALIGEHLMRQDHPGRALESMLQPL